MTTCQNNNTGNPVVTNGNIYVINAQFLLSKSKELYGNISQASLSNAIIGQKLSSIDNLTNLANIPFDIYNIGNHDIIYVLRTYDFVTNTELNKAVALYQKALKNSVIRTVYNLVDNISNAIDVIQSQINFQGGSATLKMGCDQQAAIGSFLGILDLLKQLTKIVQKPQFTSSFLTIPGTSSSASLSFSEISEDIFDDIMAANNWLWSCNNMDTTYDSIHNLKIDTTCDTPGCLSHLLAYGQDYFTTAQEAFNLIAVPDIEIVVTQIH